MASSSNIEVQRILPVNEVELNTFGKVLTLGSCSRSHTGCMSFAIGEEDFCH